MYTDKVVRRCPHGVCGYFCVLYLLRAVLSMFQTAS